jgi:hypothetical protein
MNTAPLPLLAKGIEARRTPIWRVSGKKRSTSRALASATIMAIQNGTAGPRGNTFHLGTKGGKSRQESSTSGTLPESKKTQGAF